MSAGESLQPRQFHGARLRIDDTHVRPPSVTGAPATSSAGYSSGPGVPSHKELAFATPSEHIAWLYARSVPPFKDHPVNHDPDPKYRSRVYTVAPSKDQFVENAGDTEIKSRTGYRITGAHDIEPGETGTFPSHNWNAFKRKSKTSPLVENSHMDMNHSYMQNSPASKPAPVKHEEVPGQMNLLTGKTVEEHKEFVGTPGAMLSRQFSAPDIAAFDRDPTVKPLRRRQDYHHSIDEHFGTVH